MLGPRCMFARIGSVARNPSERPSGPAPKRDRTKKLVASNRRASYDYAIEKTIEAGLVMVGSEVKSLRGSGASLQEAFARFENGELWLERMHVPPLPQASYLNHDPLRRRKCLVHRREATKLEALLEQGGRTLVPLSLYWLGHRLKVELGVGRARKKGDKRAAEREKDDRFRARQATGRGRPVD